MSVRSSIERSVPSRQAAERNVRFQKVLQEVLPEVRRRRAGYSDERVFVTAVHLAPWRLWKEVVTPPETDGAA